MGRDDGRLRTEDEELRWGGGRNNDTSNGVVACRCIVEDNGCKIPRMEDVVGGSGMVVPWWECCCC